MADVRYFLLKLMPRNKSLKASNAVYGMQGMSK